MNMRPVKSSNVSHVGYEGGVLAVRFKSGNEYRYSDVPADVHQALLAADSLGKHFHANIRGRRARNPA